MDTISDRFIWLINNQTSETRRFKELEELSGIPAVSWRKAYLRGQRPTVEMIEIVSQQWPQHAFWLATGISDPDYGHVAPRTARASYVIVRGIEQKYSTQEFEYLIAERRKEPQLDEALAEVTGRLVDEVHQQRENDLIKAKYFNFDKAMHGYGEPGRPELYMIEIDPNLAEIRAQRRTEIDTRKKVAPEWRDYIYKNIKVEKFLNKVWNSLRKITPKA